MAETKAKEEGESASSSNHTPPPSSPPQSPSANPRKRKNPKDLLPSLSNCHSCDRHFPPRPQTLTSLRPLDSQWRIVLLCDECLRLVKSASKCSYCFLDFSGDGSRRLGCHQCSCTVHIECVPAQQRFISASLLNPDSFVCVDCCPLPKLGNNDPTRLFTRVSIEELMREAKEEEEAAARAKEKALVKVKAANLAAERAKEALSIVSVENVAPAVKDQELALQLHLAMNGSTRISRSGRSMSSDQTSAMKKFKQRNNCSISSQKAEFCTEDKGFFDSWNSSDELSERKEAMKGNDGCSSSNPLEVVVKEEQGSSSDKVSNSCEDSNILAVWITYQKANKSKCVSYREESSDTKRSLNGVVAGEVSSESDQISRHDPSNRYAKKYTKRKSILEKALNGENKLVSCQQSR